MSQHQLFLSFFFSFFMYYVSWCSTNDRHDFHALVRQYPTEERFNAFITENPSYINKYKSSGHPETTLNEQGLSLAFFLICEGYLDLAQIMAQHGDRFDDTLRTSNNVRHQGSTPLIRLLFRETYSGQNKIIKPLLIHSIIKNNPYSMFDKRNDGMTPFLTAIIMGDLSSAELIERVCTSYNSCWIDTLYKQRTTEGLTALDLLKYPINRTHYIQRQQAFFNMFIRIRNHMLHEENISPEELQDRRARYHNSIQYLEERCSPKSNLRRLIDNTAQPEFEARFNHSNRPL